MVVFLINKYTHTEFKYKGGSKLVTSISIYSGIPTPTVALVFNNNNNNILSNMCEGVAQQTPEFFRKLSKKFRFYVTDTYPTLPTDGNFAMAFHNTRNTACVLEDIKHWHLLIYTEYPHQQPKNFGPGSTVSCPYTCFAFLIHDGVNMQCSGGIFDKLMVAVEYNNKYETTDTRFDILKKYIPKLPKTLKKDQQTQTTVASRVQQWNAFWRFYMDLMGGSFR